MNKKLINKFYVYLHSDPRTGKVVYVGKGCGGRAWDVTRNRGKSSEHCDYLVSLCNEGFTPNDYVIILRRNMSEKEATDVESSYMHTNGLTRFNRRCGERNYQAKLTTEQVRKIYKLTKTTKMTHAELAVNYGVSRTCISQIAAGRQWKSTTADLRKQL